MIESDDITWDELTEVKITDDIRWPDFSCDLDPDCHCPESEDYYQDQGKFLLPKTWQPPKKSNHIKPHMSPVVESALKKLLQNDKIIFLIKKEELSDSDDFRQDFLSINNIDKLNDAVIYAFPRKYILPVRAGQYSHQAVIVFYDPYKKLYLDQYIFAEKHNKTLNKNNSYLANTAEQDYAKARDSYAEYLSEMAHSETSTNCRIFGVDAKSAFIKSAKQNYEKY